MRHFDVVLSEDFLQGFGEGRVVGKGDVEGEVWSLSGGLLRSRRSEVSAACFVHDGSDTLRRESVEEADVSDCLQLSLQVLWGTEVVGSSSERSDNSVLR